MSITAEGQVGPRYVQDGSSTEYRLSKDGSAVTVDAHGRFYEASYRGTLFSGGTAVGGTTVAAANVSPPGAAAATVLSLYNPLSSGIVAALSKTVVVNVSGTPGAGNAWSYDIAYNQVITAAPNNFNVASAMPTSHYASSLTGKCVVYTQTALTGGGAHSLFRVLGHVAFATALAATTPNLRFIDPVDGEIIVPPGGLLTISPIATGTAHVVCASFTWEELPI